MGLSGTRTYVGFGFGAIQAGLLLYEAFGSGAFSRLVVAEVVPEVVAAVRRANGLFAVNIAHADRVQTVSVGPVEIEDPAGTPDRRRLIEAIAGAEEIGTAIPSVTYYVSEGLGSLHCILAEGLRRKAAGNGPRAVVYTAENHNHAAEILASRVMQEIPEAERDAVHSRVRFLNTVIGKMSGVVSDPDQMAEQGLTPITPAGERAFLVEAFNRIFISKIEFDATPAEPPFRRGIRVFEEKENLLPFEEAKLYGHNATHALAAYIGAVSGVERIADLRNLPGTLAFLRAAFIEESGAALILRHGGTDPLFTREGYTAYADDLLARMTSPYLRDTVERVGRDPARKLGWDDRLVGTMRVALRQGIEPWRYAFGAAAALATMAPATLDEDTSVGALLKPLWREASPEQVEQEAILGLVEEGRRRLRGWREAGFPDLHRHFSGD
jgi:mannitol-1-phosphate 5-dehydrogenase